MAGDFFVRAAENAVLCRSPGPRWAEVQSRWLDIYLQHDSPGKDKESNWLPADAGAFNVMMRMYWPKESVLNGTGRLRPSGKQADIAPSRHAA